MFNRRVSMLAALACGFLNGIDLKAAQAMDRLTMRDAFVSPLPGRSRNYRPPGKRPKVTARRKARKAARMRRCRA